MKVPVGSAPQVYDGFVYQTQLRRLSDVLPDGYDRSSLPKFTFCNFILNTNVGQGESIG
jgi:hypothetical protein